MGIWGSQTVVTRFVWSVFLFLWLIVYCIYLIGSWFMTLSSARITTDLLVCKQCNFPENIPSFMYLCNHYPSSVCWVLQNETSTQTTQSLELRTWKSRTRLSVLKSPSYITLFPFSYLKRGKITAASSERSFT